MCVYIEVKNLFDGLLYGFDARVAKFDHLSGIGQNHVIVLAVKI
jgi:hypothetical protein